jgi:hypothetical protein
MNASLIFPVITLILLVVAIIWKSVDWKALAIKWVGNNPKRAQVYLKAGDTVRTVQGERFYIGADGDYYHYKPEKITLVVITPRKPIEYPYEYIRGRRIIGIEDGQVVASPLGFMTQELKSKYNEGVSDLSSIEEGNTMVKAIHSIKSNRLTNWLIYAIIAVVIAGGIYFYMNNKRAGNIQTANVTQNQTMETVPSGTENGQGNLYLVP